MTPTKENILDLFLKIDDHDFLQKVSFYEERCSIIFQLEEKTQNYFKYEFVQALFDLGRYEKVLVEVDDLIEYVFLNNINYVERNYDHLIFLKAASLFGLRNIEEALVVSKQLVAINPENELYASLLTKVLYHQSKMKTSIIRSLVILLVMISAIICGVFLLKKSSPIAQSAFNTAFGINLFVLTVLGLLVMYNQLAALSGLEKHISSVRKKTRDPEN